MKYGGIAGVVLLLALVYFGLPHVLPPSTLTYHGEVVQLSRWYWSYDDYKNDPDNIAVHDRTRVAELMRAAPVGRSRS